MDAEHAACFPEAVDPQGFNPLAQIPYGLTAEHIYKAMQEFVDFLGFLNQQLHTRSIRRLETMLMSANFSSMVGEFMKANIPTYCPTLTKNVYFNGHPDLIPKGMFTGNAVQHGHEGIEVKASRYLQGWQGHNPEATWLMVFVFASNRADEELKGVPPFPFRFEMVLGAQLLEDDWSYSGRTETSRRTITASVLKRGRNKMAANWIYRRP